MKPHRILKAFNGSQTGHDFHSFVPGDKPVHLSDDLAKIAVAQGWAEPHVDTPQAKNRDTKVAGPEEVKRPISRN